jgi:hypothetical protein
MFTYEQKKTSHTKCKYVYKLYLYHTHKHTHTFIYNITDSLVIRKSSDR